MLVMEVLYAPRLLKLNTAFRYITMKNMGASMYVVAKDRPAIMLSGHYGNWELLSFVMAAMGLTSYTVARHLPNPYIHRYVFGVRERTGQRFLTKKGATATVTEVLSNNQIVCFLADQDAGSRGEFVKFFGRDASTFRSIALLARMYEAPIVIAAATRIGHRFRYEFNVEEVINPEQWQGKDDEVAWITARYTKAIERIARRCPQQYLWVHRRWKSKPLK
jgi:KDO2-lipid IV(A) lauroyltransferase